MSFTIPRGRLTATSCLVLSPRWSEAARSLTPAVRERITVRSTPSQAERDLKTQRVMAATCCHCGTDVSDQAQRCRHRYDHIDLPPIRPIVTRVELYGGRCRGCGARLPWGR